MEKADLSIHEQGPNLKFWSESDHKICAGQKDATWGLSEARTLHNQGSESDDWQNGPIHSKHKDIKSPACGVIFIRKLPVS